ncbi:MAG: FAD-binding oxidoreductase [Acidimicrobiia bacterium]
MPAEDPTPELLSGWGRTNPTAARVLRPSDPKEVADAVGAGSGAGRLPDRGLIARGLGRSYGDAAQNAGGVVVDATALARIHAVDLAGATVVADAGISLDALMRTLLPLGLFPAVTPGTRAVTLGGAIAAYIHVKNHHADGSLGEHVRSLVLHTPSGRRVVGPDAPAEAPERELFWATVGGMGLTGIVTEATVGMIPVETSRIRMDTERASDLDDVLDRMTSGDAGYRYSVAWIDCLARGARLGRSVLTRGDHAGLGDLGHLPAAERAAPGAALRFDARTRLAAPPWVPRGLLNRWSVAAFNEVWFRKAPRAERGRVVPLAAFFHPLDGLSGWNRIYGRCGFVQYQFVVPFGAEGTLRSVLERLAGSGRASFLAVLKRFGEANPGYLSFPAPGWTLALDMPAGGAGLAGLLDGLDQLVVEAGGRVYLAKDSRLRPELVPAMYPRLDAWREVCARVDPGCRLRSDLSRRLRLRLR